MTTRIQISTVEGAPRLAIEGTDVTSDVREAELRLRPGLPPRLVIEVDLVDVSTLGALDAEVVLGSGHDALVALGWTPPKDSP